MFVSALISRQAHQPFRGRSCYRKHGLCAYGVGHATMRAGKTIHLRLLIRGGIAVSNCSAAPGPNPHVPTFATENPLVVSGFPRSLVSALTHKPECRQAPFLRGTLLCHAPSPLCPSAAATLPQSTCDTCVCRWPTLGPARNHRMCAMIMLDQRPGAQGLRQDLCLVPRHSGGG